MSDNVRLSDKVLNLKEPWFSSHEVQDRQKWAVVLNIIKIAQSF